MTCPANRVVIVGGGLSGLAAAVQLGRMGVPTVLFDDAGEIGGRARTDRREGFHMNVGPHRLYERGAAVRGLRALGVPVDSAARGPSGGFAIWRGEKHTLPVGYCSLLTTGLIGLSAKREIARLLAAVPTVDVSVLQRVPIAEWLETEVRDPRVVELILAMVRFTTYSDEPNRQSAAAALAQLTLSLTGSVLYVHRGWASLVGALRTAAAANGATIVAGRRVASLDVVARRAEGVVLDDGTLVACRAVIIATGPRPAERLLNGAAATEFVTTPIRVAALDVALRQLPVKRAVFAIGVDVPVCFSADSTVARVAPGAGAVVHLAKYLPTGVRGSADDEQHLERTLDLLQPGWRKVVVFRRFLATVVVSHGLVTAESGGFAGRPTVRMSGLDNVFLAGDWIGPTGQLADASVSSGIQAAQAAGQLMAGDKEIDWHRAMRC
jgi:glycine/D-amino acid oxidase-like deaminating enzyme